MKSRVKILESQKERLLSQLAKLEDQSSAADKFFKRVSVTLSRLLQSKENKLLYDYLDHFVKLLKNDTDIKQLERAFQQIKDAALKEDFNGLSEEKRIASQQNSLFSKKKRKIDSDRPDNRFNPLFIYLLKESYQDILNEFRLNIDKTYINDIGKIEKRISRARNIDDFSPIKKDVLFLIQTYTESINEQREQTTAFIKEVGNRILDIESSINVSVESARETRRTGTDFTELFERHLVELRKSVSYSKTLTELKTTVVSKLDIIQNAVKNRLNREMTQMSNMVDEMENLQNNFNSMKEEISNARKRAKQLEKELVLDSLTGIYNRRTYSKRIEEELQRYHRYGQSFSILLFDVDHFKQINDNYGHSAGDKCLKGIIDLIKPVLRKSDLLYRFGGEEFIIIFPATSISGAARIAEKIRRIVEKTEFIHKNKKIKVTISIGATAVKPFDTSPEIIFNRIDKAMYKAKQDGRNRTVFS